MPRLFTVHIVRCEGIQLPSRERFTYYEAEFAGQHFSRFTADEIKRWVRVSARNRFGKETQVIFLTESERI